MVCTHSRTKVWDWLFYCHSSQCLKITQQNFKQFKFKLFSFFSFSGKPLFLVCLSKPSRSRQKGLQNIPLGSPHTFISTLKRPWIMREVITAPKTYEISVVCSVIWNSRLCIFAWFSWGFFRYLVCHPKLDVGGVADCINGLFLGTFSRALNLPGNLDKVDIKA